MTRELPIIDVDEQRSDHEQMQGIGNELDRAFTTTGFCYLINTGIEQSIIDRAYDASKRFHALPASDKQRIAINAFHRGYIAPKTSVLKSSTVTEVSKPNVSESLMIMHEVSSDDPRFGQPLHGPNQWPEGLPGLREAVIAYDHALLGLARYMTRVIALALALPAAYFEPYFSEPTTWLRLLHYPPVDADDDGVYGAAPHTDYGFITILSQDPSGGLQVRGRDGAWIDANPIPGSFVLNVADILARWTNDRWVSTPHSVRNRNPVSRFSIPYFYDPSTDALIEPLESSKVDGPPRYRPVRFGDYVLDRLNQNYAYRQAS